ncbi:hypothetical protein PR048_028115 [Dryococelus australis]|uniref:Peptidase aspartic putative domain-containing protein n=1 Tax=Dryococelus australis TaxID=614101 RepID=A0ABQ9GIC6_9NEOP|nr:hypothetical protein PR048_028115 [Dryococelus australis]
MEFLRKETEQEERISIAIKGFNIGSRCDSRVMVPGGSEKETSIATPADLMLIVRIKGKTVDRHIRILIDTDSQCSYITKELTAKVGYQSVREEELRLDLFGGHQSNKVNHTLFHLTLENSDSNYVCDFDTLDHNTMCCSVYTAKREVCQSALKETGIKITDDSSPIQVLVRADVAEVFEEWKREGIVQDVKNFTPNDEHSLPNRPVIKEQGTTKVRPVFDASYKVSHGPFLNDCLEEGPNLIEAIPPLLLWFRLRPVGVIANI